MIYKSLGKREDPYPDQPTKFKGLTMKVYTKAEQIATEKPTKLPGFRTRDRKDASLRILPVLRRNGGTSSA